MENNIDLLKTKNVKIDTDTHYQFRILASKKGLKLYEAFNLIFHYYCEQHNIDTDFYN